MTAQTESPLADDVETTLALRAAAEDLDGLLLPQGDGVSALLLPDATWTVRPTGLDPFPFSMAPEGADASVALPACGDPQALRQVLSSWQLGEPGSAFDPPALQAPAGWDLLPGVPLHLERTDPTVRGWPTAAEVHFDHGMAVVQVAQILKPVGPFAEQVIVRLLPRIARSPVSLRRLSPRESAEAEDPALAPLTVAYELRLPASLLTTELLGAALATVADLYRQMAPVLEALVTQPALAYAYLSMNTPSPGVVSGPTLPYSGG